MPELGRADARITATLDGVPVPVVWDEFEGGDVTAEVRKYRAGGHGKERARGGQKTTEDVTIRVGFDPLVQIPLPGGAVSLLGARRRVGRGQLEISLRMLDANSNPTGEIDTYTGVLAGVVRPTHESTTDETAMVEWTMSADEK